MSPASIIFGAPEWAVAAALLGLVALVAVGTSYGRGPADPRVRGLAALLKTLGLGALLLLLLEPLVGSVRPRPGANRFLVLADNSRSLRVRDPSAEEERAAAVRRALTGESDWKDRLEQDFDVRRYLFDARLKSAASFEELDFEGTGSALGRALATLEQRFAGQPVGGILLFSDGVATDRLDGLDLGALPPIYPVLDPGAGALFDLGVERVQVSQTHFEANPVTLRAEIASSGGEGESLTVQVRDEAGQVVAEQSAEAPADGESLDLRFQLQPESGVSFYRVSVRSTGREAEEEATLENNERLAVVDRGGGPLRVLYVSGRPNWEFKFLRRALQEDAEVQLVGLLRIARREPKFQFLGPSAGRRNQLYKGFEHRDEEEAEEYDQPVLLRLGTEDEHELKDGFPVGAEELFRYSALVVDDLEAEFFSGDQMSLIHEFVSLRGGGLLMLGGMDSFRDGGYAETPVARLLPIYLDRVPAAEAAGDLRLELSRDGLLEPWVRLRSTEQEERRALRELPGFKTLSRVGPVRPGAVELLRAVDGRGEAHPALVTQRYGRGRGAALLIGDLWRGSLHRPRGADSDVARLWRQTLRWLVSDVPGRVEVEVRRAEGPDVVQLITQVRDADYQPLDNARVTAEIERPDGTGFTLSAAPVEEAPGSFAVRLHSRQGGAWRAELRAEALDGSEVGRREVGWVAQPAAEELRRVTPDLELLDRLARETGGQRVAFADLEELAADLPNRRVPVTEQWTWPLWHQWWVFAVAVLCLCGEWAVRRLKGLP